MTAHIEHIHWDVGIDESVSKEQLRKILSEYLQGEHDENASLEQLLAEELNLDEYAEFNYELNGVAQCEPSWDALHCLALHGVIKAPSAVITWSDQTGLTSFVYKEVSPGRTVSAINYGTDNHADMIVEHTMRRWKISMGELPEEEE